MVTSLQSYHAGKEVYPAQMMIKDQLMPALPPGGRAANVRLLDLKVALPDKNVLVARRTSAGVGLQLLLSKVASAPIVAELQHVSATLTGGLSVLSEQLAYLHTGKNVRHRVLGVTHVPASTSHEVNPMKKGSWHDEEPTWKES